MSWVTFTINTYQIRELVGKGQRVSVYMYDEANQYRGSIDFIPEDTVTQNVVWQNGIVSAFMPLDRLHVTLDILRNEQPVYFGAYIVEHSDNNWAQLSTGTEPTGEEETP